MNDHIQTDATRQPVVAIVSGEVLADSRDVAAYFEKNHKDVLRAIESAHCSDDFRRRNFAPTVVREQAGAVARDIPIVNMTKDGFAFVAMGFTGHKAGRFKEAYIDAFNTMEAELRDRTSAPRQIDVRDPSQLASIALQLIEVNRELESRAVKAEAAVEEAKPKTLFFDRFASADGLYGLQNAARVLGEPPNKFVGWLKTEFLFYQGGALVPKVQYRQMGVFEVKATIVDDKARYQSFVTPKGIHYLAKKLGKAPPDTFGQVA